VSFGRRGVSAVGKHITTEVREGVTMVTARDGLFDVLPETDESGPLAAEVVTEFRSAVAGAEAVVVDLRRAGEVNKRTLNVSFQFVHALTAVGARRALCGSADLKQIWDLCRGGAVSPCFEDLAEAVASVSRPAREAEPSAAADPARPFVSESGQLPGGGPGC
jgi:hypothetical protein